MSEAQPPYSPLPDGLRIVVRLTPAGGADKIEGLGEDASGQTFLKARVRAAPEDGKANDALEALLAKALRVPKSSVTVARGGKSRIKTIDVTGDPKELLARIASLASPIAKA